MAVTRALFEAMGGFAETRRGDFDFLIRDQLGSRVPMLDCTAAGGAPQFYFRWASTGQPHAESFGTDEGWMQRMQAAIAARLGPAQPGGPLTPKMDEETATVCATY